MNRQVGGIDQDVGVAAHIGQQLALGGDRLPAAQDAGPDRLLGDGLVVHRRRHAGERLPLARGILRGGGLDRRGRGEEEAREQQGEG